MFPLNNFKWPLFFPWGCNSSHTANKLAWVLPVQMLFTLAGQKCVSHFSGKKKVKIFRLSHKTRFNVSCVSFYGFSCDFTPVSYSRCFGRLVRFIHPRFDTWCRPTMATRKKKKEKVVQLLLWCCTGGAETGMKAHVAESAFWSWVWWYTGVIQLQLFLNWRRAIQLKVGAGFRNL